MTDMVRYTGKWNGLMLQPIGGYDWLETDEARALYEMRPGPGVMVVGGDTTGNDFVPRWVIGFGVGPGVRVQFYDPLGTRVRLVDYDGVGNRLWHWITKDQVYPNTTQRWHENESVMTVKTSIKPDGIGHITTVDKSDPSSTRPVRSSTPIEVLVRDSYWLDRPAFGDWSALADPGPSAWEVAEQPVPTRTS